MISGIFSEAIDLGYSETNPAYGLLKKILPPENKRNLTEPDPFNREDPGAFLEAAWAKVPEPFPLILEIMAMTGMRLGEATGAEAEICLKPACFLTFPGIAARRYGQNELLGDYLNHFRSYLPVLLRF